ncbi:MAG: wax ester/triacylglycerol synthase family O-acyltransferase [Halioglobus sp.]|nr:wax ester/triacylglycerol synthase family O-acyltransferase [Halioglobus sp.]
MKQLGILDAAFVNLEQANTPQQVGGLGIYDPSSAPGGFVRFKDVIASFERRLGNLPLFRTRLVEVPGGLDRPYWVKDANFDVEFHLRHIALPEPGDWRQLCIQVARLHSRPLDLSRPLWEAYIIEALDNIPHVPKGSFAVYTKMHHSLVDGAGGASFMTALHDLVPEPDGGQPAQEPRLVDVTPSVAELLTKASLNSVKNSVKLVGGTLKNTQALGKYAIGIARKDIPPPEIDAPKTIFNRPVGPHRVFDAAEFPLEGFKDIKNAVGVTVNDVAMAVIGRAMLRYLQARGEAPAEGSLAAGLPVNMRTRRGVTDDNNQVGSIFASLHTDIEDPLEQLQAIYESTTRAKQSGEASPMVDALKIAGVLSPFLSRSIAGFWSRNELSQYIPFNISTCISNVPGPDFPLYCAGARMVDYYGLGVLTPGMGIFHLAFSYADKITLSVLADRDIMPDPEFYHDCLVDAYEEFYAAAIKLTPGAARRADVAAKAKIRSPKRKRAIGSSRPKSQSARSAAGKKSAAGKSGAATAAKKARKKKAAGAKRPVKKAAPKKSARNKDAAKPQRKKTPAAANTRPKADKAVKTAGKATRNSTRKSPARPKITRRGGARAQPKLRST